MATTVLCRGVLLRFWGRLKPASTIAPSMSSAMYSCSTVGCGCICSHFVVMWLLSQQAKAVQSNVLLNNRLR